VGAAATISALASAAGSSATQASGKLTEKVNDMLPETVKKWLADSISSKHKMEVGERKGSPFLLTRGEVVSYSVAIALLTVAFAYAKSPTLSEMLDSMPFILATSILVGFVNNFVLTIISRRKGVWTEHRLWYVGLSLFVFSTFVFKVPFSSPSRLAHYSPKMTKRMSGLLSSVSILVAYGFALFFLTLFLSGFNPIGNVGLIMCLTMVFFDTLPIPPMGGKGIFDWNKTIWLLLFAVSISAYASAIILL
jgi:Zn-dependent protease